MTKRKVSSSEVPMSDVYPTQGTTSQCGIGKIKSVFCKDFVTYEECTFYPTEYLNIIIGPNGTGKSTLVAAIVLGLGGDPKLLSRSSSIKDYIKNGKTMAQIEVEIVANKEGKCIVFHRSFDDTGKSEYQVNREVVSKNNFLKAVAEFKIQINNLCQFLPQDKVQDFAKMNPQEILGNTITSVCTPNVISDFAKLKELRKHQLNGKKCMENDLVKLRESITRREELKQILERYNAKKQFIEKLDICNAKKLWLEVTEIERKAEDIRKDLFEASKSLNQRQKAYDSAIKNQEAIVKKSNELKEDAKRKMEFSKSIFDKKDKVSQQIEEAKKKIRVAKTDFEKSKREWNERQDDLRNEARMLEVIVEDLKIATAALGQDSDRESKLRVLSEQLDKFKIEIKKNVQIRSDINKRLDAEFSSEIQMLKKRIERSKNVAVQKLQLLQNDFPDVHKAVMWLEENGDLFQGTIYKPMILELNVPDPKNAKYFENTIPLRDLLSFVCENKADVSTLVDELCIKQKLSINVAHSPPATECRYKPNEPIRNIEQFGFNAYLIDLLDGPPAVLNYLCSLYKLHSIPIGSEQVNKCTDTIPTNIRQYFGGDQRYNVSISKYSKEPSLMQSRIQGKNILLSCDLNEVQNLQRSLNRLLKESDVLKNERTSIEAKINEIEFQCQDLNNKRRAIDANFARFKQLKDQLKRQHLKIGNLKANTMSVADMAETFKKTTQMHLRKIIELQKEKVEILQSYQKAIANKKIADVAVQMHKEQTEELTNAITEATDNLKQSQNVLDSVTRAFENAKKMIKVKTVQALNSTNNCSPSNRKFPYTEAFSELPNDLEQLKETINDFAARLDCMGDVDQEIVTEYERRCADIEALEKSIADTANGDKDLTADITTIYTNWYSEICRVVDTLNEHFGKFMDSMSYVGEVLLAKKDDFDFDSYGIQIMVQYRKNVPLQALDRHVQSGGERAVAIAVYTLSLQHITHVPFRCVDEINQGMDARNERKIFDMLVDETTKTGRSQYFFVTPKTVVAEDRKIPNCYGDRFIPRRYMLCNIERNAKFANKEVTEDILKKRFSMQHSRQNCFCLAINQCFGVKDRRILEFGDLHVNGSYTPQNDKADEFIYGRLNGCDWPCKPRSKPLAFTDTTHDLPGFDFSSDLNLVDWSVNEHIIASFGRDLIIWKRCEDLTMIFSIKNSRAISCCPNGRYLAIGCKTRCWPILELWDISSYNDFVVINGKVFGQKHANILCIEWSKSGNQMVCGTHSGTIYVLSVPGLKTIKKIHKHKLPVTMIKFSPTMRYLACGDVEGNLTIICWNTCEIYFHLLSVRKLKVTFDWHPWNGVDLAISEELPASIVILHVPTVEIVAYCQRNDSEISIDSVTFSKLTAELLVSVSENTTDGCINTEILVMSSLDRIVDVLKLPETGARFMMWSPDGTKLASAGNDETLTIWNFHYGSGIKNKPINLRKKNKKQPFGAPFGLQFNMWSSCK